MRARLQQILADFYTGRLEESIKTRRLELAYPYVPESEQTIKVSEGFSADSPTEREAVKYAGDVQLARLERRLLCVRKFEDSLDDERFLLLRMRYMRGYSWVKVALELHVSRRTCFNWHNEVLEDLAKYLAWEE